MSTPELISWVKKNRVVTACIIVSVGLAVGIYLRFDAIPDANALLDEKSSEARRYALNIANAAQLKSQLDALKTANRVMESRMLHATDIGINQQYFYKLESESGVKLIDIRQSRVARAKGDFAPIAFTVALKGDFTQALKFLRGLEDRTHYCRVLTATCTGGRSGPVTLALDLEILGHP